MFWILRNCLVLEKLVVKESSTGKGITVQQFFSQMTKRNEKFWNAVKVLELHYNDYDQQIGTEEGDKILVRGVLPIFFVAFFFGTDSTYGPSMSSYIEMK